MGKRKFVGFFHEFLNKLERKSKVSDHRTFGMDVSVSVFYTSEPFYFSDTKIGKDQVRSFCYMVCVVNTQLSLTLLRTVYQQERFNPVMK